MPQRSILTPVFPVFLAPLERPGGLYIAPGNQGVPADIGETCLANAPVCIWRASNVHSPLKTLSFDRCCVLQAFEESSHYINV